MLLKWNNAAEWKCDIAWKYASHLESVYSFMTKDKAFIILSSTLLYVSKTIYCGWGFQSATDVR